MRQARGFTPYHFSFKSGKGFTLIELLVVVAIIGLLASVILVSLGAARVKTRDATRLAELHQFQNALEIYYTNHGTYPGTENTWYDNACTDVADNGTAFSDINPLIAGILGLPEDPLPNYGCMWYLPFPADGRLTITGTYAYAIMFIPENYSLITSGPHGTDCYGGDYYCFLGK